MENAPIYLEPKFDYVIIKINENFIKERGSVYEATRRAWKAKLENAQKYKYVLAVNAGIVLEVFEVEQWQVCAEDPDRIEFVGHVAPDSIAKQVKGKMIPEYYRVKGLASPFLYKKGGFTPDADSCNKEAEEKAKAEAEKAKAEINRIAAAKAAADKAKTELERQKAEAEATKAELERIKAEAAKAKAEAEKANAAAAKAKAEAERAKAQAEAEKTAATPAPAATTATKGSNGALPGLFSVAANKKVHFSMGNLQFNPKKYEFRFALHQYDVIRADNSKIAPNYDGWIDLFGYGTSGYMGCEPTEKSENSKQYPNQYIDNTNYDWGVYNPISNGGNKEGLWRTLTKKEWEYLFETRPKAAKLLAPARVNHINGLIVLPDDFFEHRIRVPLDNSPDSFSDNTYDLAQWSILEEAGAIFLPCGGYRSGQIVNEALESACYWSSTNLVTTNVKNEQYYAEWHLGFSVRLVQDVK